MQAIMFVAAAAASTFWTANDPFVGHWKLDVSKSTIVDDMKVESLGPNKFAFNFENSPTETIVADGTDQPGLSGTTLSVKQADDGTLSVVRKQDGKVIVSAHWKLSPDGRTLHDAFTGLQDDGSNLSTDYVYRRTAGTSGFAGTWESTTKPVGLKLELDIQPYEKKGLSFASLGSTKNVTFDGRDHPAADSRDVTFSGQRRGERAMDYTEKNAGKVAHLRKFELSQDGRTLTETLRTPGHNIPDVFVFERAEPTPSQVENWAGGYVLNGRHVSLSLRMTGAGASPSITASSLAKGLSDEPLTNVSWKEGRLHGQLKIDDEIETIDAREVASELTGAVAKDGARGTLDLVRLADMPVDKLRSYEGAYRGRDGTYLVERLWVGHWMLNIAEERSGAFRSIFPVAADRFVAGPVLLSAAPVQWRLHFTRGGLAVSKGGRTDFARRVPLRSRDVSFMNGDVRLAGTLVEPAGPGPHPAIVFMHGSGAAPRQSNFGLGYWLASQGFAVLKYDKRGSGESSGNLMSSTYAQLGDDGAAAARWLQAQPGIDPKRIGFWGISEGGWTAPLAATSFKDAAFVIIASGGGLSPAAGELLDTEDQLKTDGRFSPAQIAQALEFQRLRDAYMKSGEGWDAYAAALASAKTQPWWNYPSTDLYGWSKPDAEGWKMKAATYFYDPAPTLKALHCPVLILFGALDTPAGVEANLASLHRALDGKANATFRVFPNTSHNLFLARSGNENDLDETTRFSPEYFRTITNWLLQRTKASL